MKPGCINMILSTSVSLFPNDDPPTRTVGKQMVACFSARTGHVKTVLLKEHRTVTMDWYVTT